MFYKVRYRLLALGMLFVGAHLSWNSWKYSNQKYVSGDTAPWVVFDFDGTLVNSFELVVDTCNQLAQEYGFDPITDEQKSHLRCMSTKDIITKHLKISWLKLPFLHKRATAIMAQKIPNLSLVSGMEDVLRSLKAQGYRLGILSSNSEEGIRGFLKNNNIEIFDSVHGGSSIFGKHRVIKSFLSDGNLDPKNVIYVGDEIRDIQATTQVGVAIVAVDWGFSSRESLLAHKPNKLISHPSELVSALKSISLLG